MISIIIPIYNIEQYLARCLDSIISQTYTELEIVCIDDGSTDTSAQVCKQYMKKDNRIKYYYIPNGGVSNARNYALTLINGEWFSFIDGDDWIEPNFFETLLENAGKYNCDISACQFQMNTEYYIGHMGGEENVSVLSDSEKCIHSYICGGNSLQGQVWNKIYLTEKFRNIQFDKTVKVNEDCLYTYEIMNKCDSACVCEAQLYHWYMRENSACHNKEKTISFDAANVFLDLLNKTEKMNDIEVRNVLQYNYVCVVLKTLFDARKEKKNEEIIVALERVKTWKRESWHKFSNKDKIKYYCVMLKYII